jgi:hypothetical protein
VRISDHYRPFPHQEIFHRSGAKYRLFGGAAGPGKTKALLWEAIIQANAFDNVDTLLLRRTFPELDESLLREFRRSVPRELYKSFNESKRIVTWKNGSRTRFGYCRREGDVYQYQGGEYLFIGLDELTHFTLTQWQYLTSRNRCPVPGTFACMAGATNPGNIGHAWVKALWVDHKPPAGFDRPDLYSVSDYDFVRALLKDNPIYANDKNYQVTLERLPGNLRRALLEGDWSVFAGQYFDIFDVGRHSARVEELEIEDWWPRWISIDWGFEHPSAVYWHARTPAHHVVTYRELVQNRLSPKMLGAAIAERCTSNEKIQAIFLSPDAFAHRTAEASIAEQLAEVFTAHRLPQPSAADDDRIGGWQLCYQMLESDAWLIADNCRHLLECLPNLVRDQKHVEDITKVAGDDPADAARYGLVSAKRHGIIVPTAVAVSQRLKKVGLLVTEKNDAGKEVTSIPNMTAYAMMARKFEAEEAQKNRPIGPKRFRGSR